MKKKKKPKNPVTACGPIRLSLHPPLTMKLVILHNLSDVLVNYVPKTKIEQHE